MQCTDNENVIDERAIYKKLSKSLEENNENSVIEILITNKEAFSKIQKSANLALMAASRYGELSLVHEILTNFSSAQKRASTSCCFSKKPNVNEEVLDIPGAFKTASSSGHTKICRYFLMNEWAYITEALLNKALKFAVLNGHLNTTLFILGILGDSLNSDSLNAAFLYASKIQHVEIMERLFASRSPNVSTLHTAFVLAAEMANFTSLNFLLKNEYIEKIKNFSVQISFLNAIASGNICVIDYLMKPRMYALLNHPPIERSLVDWSLKHRDSIDSWQRSDDLDLERMVKHAISLFNQPEEQSKEQRTEEQPEADVEPNIKSYNLSKGNMVSDYVEAIYNICFPPRPLANNLHLIARTSLMVRAFSPPLIEEEQKFSPVNAHVRQPTRTVSYFLSGFAEPKIYSHE